MADITIYHFIGVGVVSGAVTLTFKLLYDYFTGKKNHPRCSEAIIVVLEDLAKAMGGISKTLEAMNKLLEGIKSDTEWNKNIHNNYDDSGAPKWFFPKDEFKEWLREQRDTNKVLSDLAHKIDTLIQGM